MSKRRSMQNQWLFWTALVAFLSLLLISGGNANALSPAEDHYALKLLGKFAFFDTISTPERQSCSSCHEPAAGGTNNNARVNLTVVAVPGANFHVSGGLKPPTNAYAVFIPPFQDCNLGGAFFNAAFPGDPNSDLYCGGNFWDGRAEGRVDPLFNGATKHIGDEVFQGKTIGSQSDFILEYSEYFGATADQALNPMPNLVEQNIQRQAACQHVANSAYAELYEIAWGEPIDCSEDDADVSGTDADVLPEKKFDITFKRLMLAVCAWQHSHELNSFSSKRDHALRAELACLYPDDPELKPYYDHDVCYDPDYTNSPGTFPLAGFEPVENEGHDIFYRINLGPRPLPEGQPPAGNCAFCHISDTAASDGTGLKERYTDNSYHNIGTPPNPAVPADPQKGIGGHVGTETDSGVPENEGFMKTPTLRNVDKRPHDRFIKAYTHNGWFKSLESIVHFYNTGNVGGQTASDFGIVACQDISPFITSERRALRANCWPAPEWPGAAFGVGPAPNFVGDLGLTAEQEAAVVAYLKTLTDYVTPLPPTLAELETLKDRLGLNDLE